MPPIYDYACEDCGENLAVVASISEYETLKPSCKCGSVKMARVISCPVIRVGGQGSYSRDIKKMKQSFRQRFVKSGEMDQVKHDYGSQFNDSLVGAATDRIRQNKNDELD